MIQPYNRKLARKKRHYRLRNKISGTAARPRLAVFRSLKHIYAQIIDDVKAQTITASSTLDKNARAKIKKGSNKEAASVVGADIALKAKERGITRVVFDRGGFLYHGRVKALAEAARENGLEF